ncbi:hypothetical protein EDB85DRAFT_2293394 [Lactarius pseudohatsudake]|nr:hypothetical protein EDB85DRAFT_2293394 [Lactarius pseudohatsudake]
MTCSHLVFQFVDQIMSFPTFQNLPPTRLGRYHLIIAVILILKHATFLRLSDMSAESALTHAEADYCEGNIDSKIRQHLTAPSQEQSDQSFAGFIMAIDLVVRVKREQYGGKLVGCLEPHTDVRL